MHEMKISAAFIGFEFEHHVPAAQIAISELKHQGLECDLKLWSGVDGIKNSVESAFKKCKFIDSHLGWHGVLPSYKLDGPQIDKIQLTQLEIKHFSYTYSRTTIFRDPRIIKKKQIDMFKSLTTNCIRILKKEEVSHIFFIDLPHTLGDLAFFYAAQRLNLSIVYKEGPFFGGDYVYPVFAHGRKLETGKINENMKEVILGALAEKNLNTNLNLPHYMTANLNYMPSVAPSEKIFFRTRLGYIFYKKLKLKILSVLMERVLLKSSEILSNVYRVHILRNYLTKEKFNNSGIKYILVLLQFHPELTSSPSAMDSPFEEERVVALANQFPGYKIVVREHPSNLKNTANLFFQYRSLKSIKKMLSKKNVTYLFPGNRLEYKNLIEKSEFTVSTSGTVAMESIFLRTPSFHFYNSFASGFPGIQVVSSVQQITKENLKLLGAQLENATDNDLINQCLKEISTRGLTQGFLSGYHKLTYSPSEYVSNASKIIFQSMAGFFKHKT